MRLADCPSRRYEQRYRDGAQTRAVRAQAAPNSRTEQVISAFGRDTLCAGEIAAKVGISRCNAATLIHRLEQAGCVVRVGTVPVRNGRPRVLFRLA